MSEDPGDGEEDEPWGGFTHSAVDEDPQPDDDATSVGPEDAPDTQMDDNSAVIAVVPPRRSTRDSTRGHRPGKDVGLNWRAVKAQQDAEDAERARNKAIAKDKKKLKSQQAAREEEGVRKIAVLEARRARADRTDAEYVKVSNASGYRATSPSHFDSGPSGSEYGADHDEQNAEDDAYEYKDPQDHLFARSSVRLMKTVCESDFFPFTHLTALLQNPTAAEKRKERQDTVLGRIKTAAHNVAADFEEDVHTSIPRCAAFL